jgi:pimeloyl-ACP methyl ester carboxylesterase
MAQDTKLKGSRALHESGSALPGGRETKVVVKAEFRPGSFRTGTEREAEVPVGDDELIELEFEDGLHLWLTAAEYREKLETEKKRAPGATGPLEVPASLPFGGDAAAERGIVGWALKSLKVVGVDVAGRTAVELARLFEDKREGDRRPGPGLYRCRMVTGDFALETLPAGTLSSAKPKLVFIHGTASTTWGSFGDLWGPARSATLAGLRKIYGGEVFAFEHRSMTESPIANALEIAEKLLDLLPDAAELDLVSHSRGGLVGELLCRMNSADGSDPFEAIDHKLVAAVDADLPKAAAEEAKKAAARDGERLAALAAALARLAARKVRIRRFVRVACPALGTTLVSRRLDRWVQILANVGRFAAAGTPVGELVDGLGDFIAAVLKERTAPAQLPGVAAMLPEAGFVRMVNNPRRPVASELLVIAGDSEPEGLWKRLLLLVADRFYAGEHDLVVNTGSMFGGAPRGAGKALLCYQQGPEVNHFNYFRNAASAEPIVTALVHPDFGALAGSVAGFEPLRTPEKPIAREVSRGPAGPRPVVFVLPGIMGSELEVDGDRVWIDFVDLFAGGLGRLRIEAAGVTPLRPYAGYYGELIDYLAETHKVVAFPYDWRVEPAKEADRLARELGRAVAEAKAANQPVRILAHSMGGLIARAMIARHPDVWGEMTSQPGARLLMLGTPNGGSYSINELVVAQSGTLRKLALLDVAHTHKELLGIIGRFPGVLALLPKAGDEDYFAVETWKPYFDANAAGWVLPDASDLERGRAFRALLESSPIDPERMIYVAGQAPATLFDMFLEGGRARFRATSRGDGQVTWDTGIPPQLRAWYAPNVLHGDLPAEPELFPAILDLLQRGTTSRLSRDEPVSREAAREFVVEPEPLESLPDERSLAAAALGAAPIRRRKREGKLAALQVRVVHGHLRFADFPVLVGHYKGDSILSAEADLDADLDGRLRGRHRLGLYPGDVGTHVIVLRPRLDVPGAFRGAIVVGLGAVGELGVGTLVETIAQGLLAYAVRTAERDEDARLQRARGRNPDPAMREVGVSALLVGTNAGGVKVRDSLLAVLEAVETANAALAGAKWPVRIATVEFVELYMSRALLAIEELELLARHSRLKGGFVVPLTVETRRGACRQIVFKEPEGWWDRLQIKGKPEPGRPDDGSLRFVAMTDRARAEARVVATQRELVDQFVRSTIRSTRHDSELTRTLFELLLPNELKERAPDRRSLVLVLDEAAARYPWELLENRFDGEGRPIALNRGLLRQLEIPVFREAPLRSVGNEALVVGDPLLPMDGPLKPLPGARDEASRVANTLDGSRRFRVTRRIQASAKEIVQAFFAAPYRILHLAGHGVYEWPAPARAGDGSRPPAPDTGATTRITGMVIGDGVYLTPAEVKQMRRVPELVFINCCHLGYLEDRDRPAAEEERGGEGRGLAPLADYHLFAANVATEFIRMGVRAVIAAGWAVDDAAARTFAEEFYAALLDGQPFGKAVESARVQTYNRHSHANTWGAYQCYGDPDYRLVELESGALDSKPAFASVEALINQVETLEAQCEARGGKDIGAQLAGLDLLRATLARSNWSGDGRAWAALGRAFNRAFQFEAAIDCFYVAIGCEDGGLTASDLEQLSNCESRAAVAQWKAAAKSGSEAENVPVDAMRARIDVAIRRLQALVSLPIGVRKNERGEDVPAGQPETRERFSLLGSAYKRKAWIAAPAERPAALAAMRDWYRKAADRGESLGLLPAYPILSWVAALIVLDWHGEEPSAENRKRAEREIAEVREDLARRLREGHDLWDRASLADLELTAALWSGGPEREADSLLERYDEVRRLASPREFESVREQIDFFADMARERGNAAAMPLERLVRAFDGATAAPLASPVETAGSERDRRGRGPASSGGRVGGGVARRTAAPGKSGKSGGKRATRKK